MSDVTLTLRPNNPSDTEITILSPRAATIGYDTETTLVTSQFAYKVVTQRGVEDTSNLLSVRFGSEAVRTRKNVTRVFNASGAVIALLVWGTAAPEALKLRSEEPVQLSDWLKRNSIPLKEYVACL